MSDLLPSSENRIIAADVVDGELVLKRYDGSSESFPLGSGFIDREILQLRWESMDLASSDPDTMTTFGGSNLEFAASSPATLKSAAYPNEDVILVGAGINDINIAGDVGLPIGDDYIVQGPAGSGTGYLYFRTAGLYCIVFQGQLDSVDSPGKFSISFAGAFIYELTTDFPRHPSGIFVMPIREHEITSDPVANGGPSIACSAWFNSETAPQGLGVNANITRIM